MKNDIKQVTVVRHLRPWIEEPSGFPNYAHRYNLGGATFLFDMDYETRQVVVSFAICAEKENFCAKKGIEVARISGFERVLPLDGFRKLADIKGGFIDAYWSLLETNKDIEPGYLTEKERLLLKKVDYTHWR